MRDKENKISHDTSEYFNITPLNRAYITSGDRADNEEFYSHADKYLEQRSNVPQNVVSVERNVMQPVVKHISPDGTVILFGTGTGLDQLLLGLRGFCTIGVDSSEAMLRQAENRLDNARRILKLPDYSLLHAWVHELENSAVRGPVDFIHADAAPEHWDPDYLSKILILMKDLLKPSNIDQGQAFIAVRSASPEFKHFEDQAVEFYDKINGLDLRRVFMIYSREGLNKLFDSAGITVLEQWYSQGGTPGVKSGLPWLQSIIRFQQK